MKKYFDIKPPSDAIQKQLRKRIDNKTKPPGSLGLLEQTALKIGTVQNSLQPELRKPSIIVFAADHGIAADGEVSPFPQEVTWQMVANFLTNGAAINVFTRQHDIDLIVVDAGVKHDFDEHPRLVNRKIAHGTRNYLHEPAMTESQCHEAIQHGTELVRAQYDGGCNTIGFGEMGIGNTSSASLLMSALLDIPLEECVGSGTGLDDAGVHKKTHILSQVMDKHRSLQSVPEILAAMGGLEIAMMAGAILQAAELGMLIINDGFIATSALLVAWKIHPGVLDYCLFSHCSSEQGHRKMLDHLGVDPLLQLNMRLGEGTGSALCLPLIQSSLDFLNHMASFESASVSRSTVNN